MADNTTNVRRDQNGFTFMDLDRMGTLMEQLERCDKKSRTYLYDLLPENSSPIADIPVRSAVNSSEHYGGMHMDEVRGSGDVVCRTENMPCVYNEILMNQVTHIEDILRYAAVDTSKITVLYNSYLINRFLDLYDQPIPLDQNHAIGDLNIPEAGCDYRRTDMAKFEYLGRDSVWARGLEYAKLEWENEFKRKKNEELAAMAEKRRAESYKRRAIRKAAGKESSRA